MAAASCDIPLSSLRSAPFSLTLGETVDTKVTAINFYGSSAVSDVGNGAQIVAVTDAVVNLQSDPLVTSATVIGLEWEDGPSNNGEAVIDYTIFYDQSTGVWIQLVTGVTETSYQTSVGLSSGSVYEFRVYSRNFVGLSLPTQISVLAAQVPDQPTAPTTAISGGTSVTITWTAPYDGASAIESYKILIRH